MMMRNRFSCCCILCVVLGLALVLLLFAVPTQVQAQPPKGPVSFVNDVAPILQKNCYACHDAKKKKGKLEIETTFSQPTSRKAAARTNRLRLANRRRA